MKKITYFIVFLTCITACKQENVIGFPADLVDEKPIFNLSADIEGRDTHLDFVAGEGQLRMAVARSGSALDNPLGVYALETQLGPLSFTFPLEKEFSYTVKSTVPFLEDNDGIIEYTINGRDIGSLYYGVNHADVLIDGKKIVQKSGGSFDESLSYPPKKIEIRSKADKNIYQIFYDPAEVALAPSMAVLDKTGLVVGSLGATVFQWNTGSTTPISLIDSSATSKYYCVTTTGGSTENKVEACGLLTKIEKNKFNLQVENWRVDVAPTIKPTTSPLLKFWSTLSFKDIDGNVYHSSLNKQPSTSFFIIDGVSDYNAPDDPTLLSANNKYFLQKLNIRFDCVLFTTYGKIIHLKNGKGTIVVAILK